MLPGSLSQFDFSFRLILSRVVHTLIAPKPLCRTSCCYIARVRDTSLDVLDAQPRANCTRNQYERGVHSLVSLCSPHLPSPDVLQLSFSAHNVGRHPSHVRFVLRVVCRPPQTLSLSSFETILHVHQLMWQEQATESVERRVATETQKRV